MQNASQNINFILWKGNIDAAWVYDQSASVSPQLKYVLDRTRVLIESGSDYIEYNTTGVLSFLSKLNWSGIKDWKQADRQIWMTTSGVAANMKSSTNFTLFYSVKRFIDNADDWFLPDLF